MLILYNWGIIFTCGNCFPFPPEFGIIYTAHIEFERELLFMASTTCTKTSKLIKFKTIILLMIIFSLVLSSCISDLPDDGIQPSDSSLATVLPTNDLPPESTNELQTYVPGMNMGSSKKLLGKCVFVNIFLSDTESSFNEDDKQKYIDRLKAAFDILNDNALKYGKSFEPIYNQPDIMLDFKTDFTIPDSISDYKWARTILNDIIAEYDLEEILAQYDADNVSYLYHINKKMDPYALPNDLPSHSFGTIYYNEIAVIPRYVLWDTYETKIATYAHEILHLFGAIDLYYPGDLYGYRVGLAEKIFPHDIMCNSYYTEIQDVSAYLIGWLDELKKEYHVFIDPRNDLKKPRPTNTPSIT